MPFDLTKLPPPDPNENANFVQKAVRAYGTPIVKLLGLQDALEKKTAPTLSDAAAQAMAPKDEGLLHLGWRLATGQGTPAEYKGAIAGGTEAVTPALVAQAASLGHGTLATVANAAMALQGAHEATDSSLPTWQRVAGGVGALSGLAGAGSGVLQASKAKNVANAAGDISSASKATGQSGVRVALDDIKKLGPGTPTTADEIAKHAQIAADVEKNPGGKLAQDIFGEKGAPKAPSHIDLVKAHETGLEDQTGRRAEILNELDKGFQKQVKARDARLDAAQKDIEKAGTQEERNFKARNKYIEGQGVQDTRNEKAVGKFIKDNATQDARNLNAQDKFKQGLVKAQAQAEAEDTKRTNQAIEEANALHQQDTIDDFLKREDVKPSEPSLTEVNRGQGPNGAQQTLRQSFNVQTPPEGSEIEPDLLPPTGGGGGGAPTPTPTPTGPVAQATRPFNQLTKAEKLGILPLLRDAQSKGGVTGDDLEKLGDTLAERLQLVKAGREGASDANNTLQSAIDTVKKSSKLAIADDGSEEIKNFKSFLRQQGISSKGLFSKTGGRTLDQAGEDVKGLLPGFNNDKESSLLEHLQGLSKESGQSPVDELVSKHQGEWWKNEPKPTAEVQDYTQGETPTLDVEPPNPPEEPPPATPVPAKPKGPKGPTPSAAQKFNSKVNAILESVNDKGGPPEPPPPAAPAALTEGGRVDVVPETPAPNLTGKAARASEAATPDLVNEDPLAPTGRRLTPEGIAPAEPHPSMGTAPAEPPAPVNEPPVSMEDLHQAISKEAAQPLAEVPFTLNGGKAPEAPAPETPDLFSAPEPEVPQVPQQGAIPARFFNSQLEAAGPHYQETQAAFKTGEAPNEAARVAGRAASRINRESIAAGAAKEKAAQIESVKQEIADPNTDALTRTVLTKWLDDNSRGFATIEPAMRMSLGLGGALVGGATDPLGNRPASALAGGALGLAAPELASTLAESGIPALAKGASAAAPYTERGLDFINRLHNSGLLSPLSVAKKAAGDIGGLTLAGIENPTRLPDMIKQFTSPEGRALISQNFREGFQGPEQEALSGLENFFQGKKNPLSWSGRTMGGLTKATKGVLGEAGFSVPEQQYYTLTAYPEHLPTKKLYEALRAGKTVNPQTGEVTERGSKILAHLSPFARIGVNRLERGWEYSPLGILNSKIKDPEAAKSIITKALLGTGATGAAYNLTPDDFVKEHPIAASTLASLGGPLGIPLLTGMALKGSKDSSDAVDWAKNMGNASQVIGRDIPGLRLLEDITGRQFPVGFARNYLSGYTNFLRPLAVAYDPEQPEVSSPDLSLRERLTNQMLSNIPIVRGTLPRK